MGLQKRFAAEIEAFLEDCGIDPATFGRQALKDPNFVFDLRREGRSPNTRTIDRVRRFMKARRAAEAAKRRAGQGGGGEEDDGR